MSEELAEKENRLIRLRKEKNISQKEMARRLDILPTTYNNYELGLRSIPEDIENKISSILRKGKKYIFTKESHYKIRK